MFLEISLAVKHGVQSTVHFAFACSHGWQQSRRSGGWISQNGGYERMYSIVGWYIKNKFFGVMIVFFFCDGHVEQLLNDTSHQVENSAHCVIIFPEFGVGWIAAAMIWGGTYISWTSRAPPVRYFVGGLFVWILNIFSSHSWLKIYKWVINENCYIRGCVLQHLWKYQAIVLSFVKMQSLLKPSVTHRYSNWCFGHAGPWMEHWSIRKWRRGKRQNHQKKTDIRLVTGKRDSHMANIWHSVDLKKDVFSHTEA